jgi:hypothetical protein
MHDTKVKQQTNYAVLVKAPRRGDDVFWQYLKTAKCIEFFD